jgi:hypothetical protein
MKDLVMSVALNGSPRKNLASQLDRLDRILDGLADGLNDAVASAVKQAVAVTVQEAVRSILTELLTNPEVVACLRPNVNAAETAAIVPPAKRTPKSTLRERFGRVSGWIRQQMQTACQTAHALFLRTHKGGISFWGKVRSLRRFKAPLLVAFCVGVAAGLAAFFAGPWLAAGVSALSGFTATLAVHAGLWLRRSLGGCAVTNI